MTRTVSTLILFVAVSVYASCRIAPDRSKELAAARQYREALQAFYLDPAQTPLADEEKSLFKGIRFFPIDEAYITDAAFQPMVAGERRAFPTSSGKTKYYRPYGTLHFKLKGKDCKLTVFQSDPPIPGYENSLFLPFRDETNAKTTYGNGRYMDLEIKDIKNNKIVLDFNKAYNPYCAYSSHYNCPITPYDNMLPLEVNAGVKL